MNSNRKIYWILSLLALGSYVWIGYHLHTHSQNASTLCLFKSATGVPCPSCGITRSVLLFTQGEVMQALWINPLGIIAAFFLIIIPIWVMLDLIRKRLSLLAVYTRSEEIIRSKKFIYIPLIALVALNWIWNITKGL
jgi:Protein of unknown function (DUF2752)